MPNDPRRQLTVPVQSTYRTSSPSPNTAPPIPNGSHPGRSSFIGNTSATSFQPRFLPPVRKKSLPLASRSTHPLQLEIDRLTAICEEHERVIRSSLSTIKHHVMTNMPEIFELVNKIDDNAETITASIQQSLSTYIPPFQSHLHKIVSDRSSDVEVMRHRTTPWKDVVSDLKSTSPSRSNNDELVGKIGRIKRISETEGEGDALTRIEMWADEVDMYLSTEIVRVKEKLASKTSKRQFLIKLISCE
ncbi:uncharacterized protein I206_103858 [Kwoniella pini CBS 10737]|uniref:Uncharacterized protein n=1 Tax=Kwoniella pini CBS 10737 TaxID=1296096 RepID=A0A1B9HSR4_9TREE|nr:uncharacterized protein I206_07811 [Kwoniella pini CBS 10737]OCF46329.1 hypothetical protein I206_07811 [Kwoniella pini CBS 10737]